MTPEEVQEQIKQERIGMARRELYEGLVRLKELQAEMGSEVEKIRDCANRLLELGVDRDEVDMMLKG